MKTRVHTPYFMRMLFLLATPGQGLTQNCRAAYNPEVLYNHEQFLESSCCMCHDFLFAHTPTLSSAICEVNSTSGHARFIHNGNNATSTASHRDAVAVDFVCRVALKGDQYNCDRWLACCEDAADCCHGSSAGEATGQGSSAENTSDDGCPATWDGWQCWEKTKPDSSSHQPCPSFLYPGYDCDDAQLFVSRVCTAASVWMVDHDTLLERSDYSQCARPVYCIAEIMKLNSYLTYGCQAASLAALCVGLSIYLCHRNLRLQPRIQVHINLFIAMIFYGCINIAYTNVVKSEGSGISGSNSAIQLNTVACRVLNAFEKFALISVYLSMLLEGFYLHWLLVNTFHQPRLRRLIGPIWGFSLLVTVIYSITKALSADELCWIRQIEAVEWVIYAPSITAIVLNLVFLFNIQRILLRQLQAHHDEPSSYRRAVKAAIVLVPPFGSTVVFLLYHPPQERSFRSRVIYECCSTIILHLQGFFVVLVLCFCNGEVLSNLKSSWSSVFKYCTSKDMTSGSMNTMMYTLRSGSNLPTDPEKVLDDVRETFCANGGTAVKQPIEYTSCYAAGESILLLERSEDLGN